MYIVPESLIAGLVFPQDAFSAMEACFAAMARGEARNFPVVREAICSTPKRACRWPWSGATC